MEITEVRVKLMEDSDDRLQAFCSITFDDSFVIRDLKIIEGTSGPFVAMPSRKLTSHCSHCGCKNHLRAAYCNQCGGRQKDDRASRDQEGRAKLYADIAHPINSECREMIQTRVVAEYKAEQERAKQPGYVSRYDDDFDDDIEPVGPLPSRPEPPAEPPKQRPPDRQQIQPAETVPRPPHKAPSHQPAAKSSQPMQGSKNDDFGAGIF
jgi:stage V sporulation protein G